MCPGNGGDRAWSIWPMVKKEQTEHAAGLCGARSPDLSCKWRGWAQERKECVTHCRPWEELHRTLEALGVYTLGDRQCAQRMTNKQCSARGKAYNTPANWKGCTQAGPCDSTALLPRPFVRRHTCTFIFFFSALLVHFMCTWWLHSFREICICTCYISLLFVLFSSPLFSPLLLFIYKSFVSIFSSNSFYFSCPFFLHP